MAPSRETPNAAKFNRHADLPYGLRIDDFSLAMQDVYDFFFDVNTHLRVMSSLRHVGLPLLAAIALSVPALGAQGTAPPAASPFEHLRFRNIGPATMGGRIDDFAVLETNPSVFYVATRDEAFRAQAGFASRISLDHR